PVLTGGLEYKSVSLSPADAEFINTAKLTTQDIARAYRVPPHMIGDLERATFSNIEHQSIQFVQQTLLPWLKNWEAELNRKLLPTDLQGEYYFRFKVEGMLRGDILSRYRAYAIARQWGWTNADEIRDLEDMNPLPDGQGQLYLTPMNMVPADMVEDQFQGDPNTDNNTNTTDDGNQNAGTAKKQPAAA
ncbi:MAG TPA: phage portal protein, partial [Elusimicrobiota bacterium]|nr:phage portal protein [Elusimicrobiota bacterium]